MDRIEINKDLVTGNCLAGLIGMHLVAKARPWNFDALNGWLHKPSSCVARTRPAFAGIGNDQQRADVISYPRSPSPNPVPSETP